jgi:peptidyl-tRNA hydrolase, PTH1 family
MALFVRRPTTISRPKYSLNTNKTKLIVGLGNIGEKYTNTRHNIGFLVVDNIASRQDANWREQSDLKCYISSFFDGNTKVILCKPTTYMNNSGEAASQVAAFYKLELGDILVVHDELDIDYGKIRLSHSGSAAGHNGIKSLISHIGEDFTRLRIGVGPKVHAEQDSADFVLGKWSNEQQETLPAVIKEASIMCTEWVASSSNITPETRTVL